MGLELASDEGNEKRGEEGRKLLQPMGWKALSNGEGRKTEKNLQVIEKEMGKEEDGDGGDICQSGEDRRDGRLENKVR